MNEKRAKIVRKVGDEYVVELEDNPELKRVGGENMIFTCTQTPSHTSSNKMTFDYKDRVQIVDMGKAAWLSEEKGTVVRV